MSHKTYILVQISHYPNYIFLTDNNSLEHLFLQIGESLYFNILHKTFFNISLGFNRKQLFRFFKVDNMYLHPNYVDEFFKYLVNFYILLLDNIYFIKNFKWPKLPPQ